MTQTKKLFIRTLAAGVIIICVAAPSPVFAQNSQTTALVTVLYKPSPE